MIVWHLWPMDWFAGKSAPFNHESGSCGDFFFFMGVLPMFPLTTGIMVEISPTNRWFYGGCPWQTSRKICRISSWPSWRSWPIRQRKMGKCLLLSSKHVVPSVTLVVAVLWVHPFWPKSLAGLGLNIFENGDRPSGAARCSNGTQSTLNSKDFSTRLAHSFKEKNIKNKWPMIQVKDE